jgi:hypothetical protein
MRPDLTTVIERVAELRERAHAGAPDVRLLAEIEDTLTEGYAHALAGDAWSMRSEQRLHELISDADSPVRGRELRSLAGEHARFQNDVMSLRRELAALRHDRDRLAATHAASA